jgi:hypothetical protein
LHPDSAFDLYPFTGIFGKGIFKVNSKSIITLSSMRMHWPVFLIAITLLAAGCGESAQKGADTNAGTANATPSVTLEEAKQIAREAYTYFFPMVDAYRIQYAYFVAKDNTEYKGNWNVIHNTPRVFTPADKAVQTPNSDTPYSMVGLDLRTEPIVLTFPKLPGNRYFSVQLIDAYTHNFAYIGTRSTGNDGGSFLVAGPKWKGELPKGIKAIIPCETELALGIYRTQLFNPADLDNVKKIQSQYKLQPLSEYLREVAPDPKDPQTVTPPPAAPISFVTPLTPELQRNSLQVFSIANFLLQFCPTHPSETTLMERFAKVGISAGKSFDSTAFSPEIQQALRDGIAESLKDLASMKQQVDEKKLVSGDMFGTREFLKNNYGYRMMAAVLGIFGNSKAEAMYPVYSVDANGKPLSGAANYVLRFAAGQLPPVNAFWSLTMYELPASLLTENPINRYLVNSPMLPKMKKDKDGGYTIYVQHASPGKDKESNWLPAPAGPFFVVMRLYGPREDALSGKWTQPALSVVP